MTEDLKGIFGRVCDVNSATNQFVFEYLANAAITSEVVEEEEDEQIL